MEVPVKGPALRSKWSEDIQTAGNTTVRLPAGFAFEQDRPRQKET
jgi:hypothetical protein